MERVALLSSEAEVPADVLGPPPAPPGGAGGTGFGRRRRPPRLDVPVDDGLGDARDYARGEEPSLRAREQG